MVRKDCNVKRFYDTEFEATLAVARSEAEYGTEMVAYRCGGHWHVGNVDPTMRSKVRKEDPGYCSYCHSYIKKGRYQTHITRRGHLRKVAEARYKEKWEKELKEKEPS